MHPASTSKNCGHQGNNNPPRHQARDVINDEPCNNLDGFSAFSNWLRANQWPTTFKQVGINEFDGESDPKTWLHTYSIIVRAMNDNNDIMSGYFPVMMSR